jgi:transposase
MNKSKKQEQKKESGQFQNVNPNAAGIDIGARVHYVAVPADRDERPVRAFECFTTDLQSIVQWLQKCNVETVAMESTGVYWIPLYDMLVQNGFNVILANAAHVKNVPGRKTDVSDCQWIQRLHTYGLLQGSFRPEDHILVFRSYARQRDNLIKSATTHVHRMQKALEQMNLQLHKVISDITGLTGMRIIRAILDGNRDPIDLAKMKHYRIRSSKDTVAKSLEGNWREEHLFVLKQEYELHQYYLAKIEEIDKQVETFLKQIESKVDVDAKPLEKASKKPAGHQPRFDLRSQLYRIIGVDLTEVAGFKTITIQTLISECGTNVDKWPTEKHFTSWLGLCPNNKITGQRIKSTASRKVVNRAAAALRMAAQTLHHSKTAIGAFYRRMRAKIGPAKANTATARKLACIYYRMLKYGKEYVDPGMEYYEEKYRERMIKNIVMNAKRFGLTIVDSQKVAEVVS